MKGGVCREAKKGGVVDRYTREGSGSVRSSEGLSRSPPAYLVAGLPASSFPLSSSTAHAPYSNDAFTLQGRVYGYSVQGRLAYQEAPDVQQTSDSLGGKADSGSSSFASTPSKKSKADFKLRSSPVPKPQVTGDRLPTAALKHSLSLSNDPEMQINLDPEMHIMRQTILDQEAVFREQVRELHRVYKVQTLLMEEMKKKDSDLLSFSSVTAGGGASRSPTDFSSSTPGGKRNELSSLVGKFVENPGYKQTSVHLERSLKVGAEFTRSDRDMGVSTPEIKSFGGSERAERVPTIRRTFDLERPPEDDDDEQERKQEEGVKPVQEIVKFIGLPTSYAQSENEVSLNLSTGWDQGKVDRAGRDFLSSSLVNEQERENTRVSKRPRELEEAPLLPLFAAKAETSVRESPHRPTPKVANRNFLGGLFQLQLGRKEETPFSVDINAALEEPEVVTKPERLSLNLEVEEKTVPVATQAQPHWLLRDKPVKKAPCNAEAPTLNMNSLQSFAPPGSCDQDMLKLRTSCQTEEAGSSNLNLGSTWGGGRQATGNVPGSRSQAANTQRQADEGVQSGIGVYRTPFLAMGAKTAAGYTSYSMGQGVGDGPLEGLTLYSSWRDSDGPKNGFPHGVFASTHSLGTVGLPTLGVQLHPSFATHAVVVGHTVNVGTGTGASLADSSPGVWYQQRSSYSQFQQYQQQQKLASLHAQVPSSQGPWQTPVHIHQGGPYPQGPVYASPAGGGSSLGLSVDGFKRMEEDPPGGHWPAANGGPPFTAFSIVSPPKPAFKRPPKLVLTHDVTTMELKLISPEKGGSKNLQDKFVSGSSEEEVGSPSRMLEWRDNTSLDAGTLNRALKDRDDNHRGYQGGTMRYPRGGKRERDDRTASSPVKEPTSPKVVDWIDKAVLSSHGRVLASRNSILLEGDKSAGPEETAEVADEADGSDGGSGGSGVGDVINPGERISPPPGTITTVGNLPAGEGEEVLHMGELGIQADSESQAMKMDRPFKSVTGASMNITSSDDKPRKHQELLQDQLAMSLASNISLTGRKVPHENSDGSEVPLKRMRLIHGSTEEGGEQVLSHALQHRTLEQSATSVCLSNMLENGSRSHALSPEFQSSNELKNTQSELQRSSGSSSEPGAPLMKLQESGNLAKDRAKSKDGAERRIVDVNIELMMGGSDEDGEPNKTIASNYGDHLQETKSSHNRQLSGASTSSPVGPGKGGEHHNPHSPGLHQVPSLNIEDADGQAEGSSMIVSQASETVQGNGRSPLRTGEWVGPTVVEQDHVGSSGGIKHSYEVDGTLEERLRGGEMEQHGKDVCPEGSNSASRNQEDLGQSDAAAIDTSDPSSSGMCISQTTTKTTQCLKGDLASGPGGSEGERQNAESRRTTALASEMDEGESDIRGLTKQKNQPAMRKTEKPEGNMDGDKDSVNSSKSVDEQGRINGGITCVSGKVPPGLGVTRGKKLQVASWGSTADASPAVAYACAPSPQSTVSSPRMKRRASPMAIQGDMDEFSGNLCDNSNLAATLLLSLAPEVPSLSGSSSKAEEKLSSSILERSTDESKVSVHSKRGPYVVPFKASRPNSSSLSSDVDSGPSASIKSQIGMQVSGISREHGRHTSLSRGDKTRKPMELRSPPKLDFFESVTLMLKENKLQKGKPMSGKDVGNQSRDLLHSRRTTKDSSTKPLRKKIRRSLVVDPCLKKLAPRSRGSEGCKTREIAQGCKTLNGFRSDSTVNAETSQSPPGSSGAVGNREDIICAVLPQQLPLDQKELYSKGGDCSKEDSVNLARQRSFWGDATRRKRMQRHRGAVPSQALQVDGPLRKVGH